MSVSIDPTAVVDPSAKLHDGVRIGPYCIVDGDVELKARVRLISHVTITGDTVIGEDSVIHPFAAIGFPPQDFKYKGEKTKIVVGQRNILREHMTIHPGTAVGKGETRLGDDCFMMIGSHIAHDCVVGNRVTFANNCALGGHVTVDDFVTLGGMALVHQHSRIGRHAFLAGGAILRGDLIPFGLVQGNPAALAGLNLVGLKRRGLPRKAIHDLRAAYRLLFAKEGTLKERIEDVRALFGDSEEVREILDFVETDAARPLCLPGSE